MTYMTGYNGTVRTLAQLLTWSQWQHLDPEMQRRVLALLDASAAAGRPLGIGEIFRSYEMQRDTFLSRHREVPSGGCHGWNGKRYQLRESMAEAAPPGFSYHEGTTPDLDALAVDFTGNLSYLKENAARYGLVEFSNVNNEPWHGQPKDVPTARRWYVAAQYHPLPVITLPGIPAPQPTKVYAPKPTIRLGAINDLAEVRALQLQCNFWGWRDAMGRNLIVDGDFGQKSAQAVMSMQRVLKLSDDGVYGPVTANALQKFLDAMTAVPPTPSPPTIPPFVPEKCQFALWPAKADKPVIKYESTGDAVRYLQGVLLCKAPLSSPHVTVSGTFDLYTAAAVMEFQKFFKLQVDGIVGAQTWKTIDWVAGVA